MKDLMTVAYATSTPEQKMTTPDPQGMVAGPSGLQALLAGLIPGGWSSNHREEANHNTGWDYICTRAVGLQFALADVAVYKDNGDPKAKSHRKSLRQQHRGNWKAYAYNSIADTPLPDSHPLVKSLKTPNDTQGGKLFRYELALQLNLTGNVLIWNIPNRFGRTVQRYVIPTSIATPMPPDNQFPNGYWRIRPEQSHWGPSLGWIMTTTLIPLLGADIPAEQIERISWPHAVFRNDGQSPLAAGALWKDTADMLDKRRWSHMKRGVRPSAVVTLSEKEFQGDEADLARISQKANALWSNPDRDGMILFLTGNKAAKLSETAMEMDYGNGFTQMRDALMGLHGVPGVAAGITDGASYAAFYASLLQFSRVTIQPQLEIIAEEETLKYGTEFGDGLTVEILAADIDDPTMLEKELTTDGAAGIRTVNEWRAVRGLPPDPTPFGDTYVKISAPPTEEQGGLPPGQDAPGGNASRTRTGNAGAPTPPGSKDTSKFAYNGNGRLWRDYPL